MLLKVLFAGPVGAGKTSAIATVSDTPVSTTEARASDETSLIKPMTTVAMDYGTLAIDDDISLQLIGTPGQDRFSFMWEILAEGAVGLIVLIDMSSIDFLSDLDTYLGAFQDFISKPDSCCVIAATHMDKAAPGSLKTLSEHVRRARLRMPVMEVDARARDDIKVVLMTVATMLNPRARRRSR